MPRARSGESGGALRAMLLVGAIGLAGAATAGVVTSEDPQVLRLAVVGALWAFVLVALAAGRQRPEPTAAAAAGQSAGKEVELRRTYEVELEREVAARREYEMQLEVYLRRELERGLQEQVQALRDEVQRLRGEMIDRLDGELRMERIETTRLIGGSLRALQDEARRLGIGLKVPREPAEPAFSVWESRPQELPATGSGAGGTGTGLATDSVPASAPASVPVEDELGPILGGSYSGSYAGSYGGPPAPRGPQPGEALPDGPRRRRYRDDGEPNEVMSRLLGR